MFANTMIICFCAIFAPIILAAVVQPQPPPQSSSSVIETEFVPLNSSTSVVMKNEGDKSKKDNDQDQKVIEDAAFWHKVATKQLEKTIKLSKKVKDNGYQRKAKNIIIFVGDGMGLTSITAGRIYKGQYVNKNNGEEEMLVFDEFPYTGLAKTYNVDKQVPDSAGTATALFTGVKSDYGAVGMDTTRNKTNANQGRLTSIMDWAQAEGKRTGIVTTTRITHATPASTYARIYHRDWECDTEVPSESVGIHVDIPRQLIENEPGSKFNVIMGGGLSPMGALNRNEKRTVNFEGGTEKICTRADGRNLTKEWLNKADDDDESRVFVQTRDQLKKVDYKKVDRLMGLFRNNHITYSVAREEGEPSLKEMTEAAIDVLQRDDSKGFVLMVEGGRIDQAHHQNYAHAAMREMLEFDMAIEAALEKTNEDETLILVTADHSHAVTLNGYPKRGADILGLANGHKTEDPMFYETLTYANGPGYWNHLNNVTQEAGSSNVWLPLEKYTVEELMSPTYRHMATIPLKDETHGGEDVIVFANGPGASLIRGVFEQNYVAYVMSYAGCMGPAKDFDTTCKRVSSGAKTTRNASLLISIISAILVLLRYN